LFLELYYDIVDHRKMEPLLEIKTWFRKTEVTLIFLFFFLFYKRNKGEFITF